MLLLNGISLIRTGYAVRYQNVNTIALEGIILFSYNKTLKWLDEMDDENKNPILLKQLDWLPLTL